MTPLCSLETVMPEEVVYRGSWTLATQNFHMIIKPKISAFTVQLDCTKIFDDHLFK
jgi:hypothetical protein